MAEAIAASGLPVQAVRTDVGLDGGYARVRWIIGDPIEIRPGDDITLEVSGRNSYNYESELAFALGAWRIICTNGLRAPVSVLNYGRKHMKNLSVGMALASLRNMIDKAPLMIEAYQGWTNTDVTPEQLERVLEKEVMFGKKATGIIVEYFRREQTHTLWTAYNALTWYSSHALSVRNEERLVVAEDQLQTAAVRIAGRLKRAA